MKRYVTILALFGVFTAKKLDRSECTQLQQHKPAEKEAPAFPAGTEHAPGIIPKAGTEG